MTKLTPENIELLEHIFNGGAILLPGETDPEYTGQVEIITGFTAVFPQSNEKLSLTDVLTGEIYLTDQQKYIIELKQKIALLESRDVLLGPARPSMRPQRRHLLEDEVRQIESDLQSGESNTTIAGTYGVSEGTVSMIRHGKHCKSAVGFSVN